jgi:hypothetical protein
MDRTAREQTQLDAAVARASALLRSPRSCVVVLTNRTSIAWERSVLTVRRGCFANEPPSRIPPWSFAVFGAQSLAAHAGAGCDGTVRYASRLGHVRLEVTYDVPYAGRPNAQIDVAGTTGHSIGTTVRIPEGDRPTNVFFLHMTYQNGPSYAPAALGVSTL